MTVEDHRICTSVIGCLHLKDNLMIMFDITNGGSRLFPNTTVIEVMTPQDSLLRIKTQSVYALLRALYEMVYIIKRAVQHV